MSEGSRVISFFTAYPFGVFESRSGFPYALFSGGFFVVPIPQNIYPFGYREENDAACLSAHIPFLVFIPGRKRKVVLLITNVRSTAYFESLGGLGGTLCSASTSDDFSKHVTNFDLSPVLINLSLLNNDNGAGLTYSKQLLQN